MGFNSCFKGLNSGETFVTLKFHKNKYLFRLVQSQSRKSLQLLLSRLTCRHLLWYSWFVHTTRIINQKLDMCVMWHLESICLTIVIPFFKFSVHLPPLVLEASSNVMAHVQKPDFVFRQNGRVHSNRQGVSSVDYQQPRCVHQLLLLVAMLDTGSEKGTGYPLHSPVPPFTSPPVHHRVPSHFNWSLPSLIPYNFKCIFVLTVFM
jgi:hypothetical protein